MQCNKGHLPEKPPAVPLECLKGAMSSVEWAGAGLCRQAVRSREAAMSEGQLLGRGTVGHRKGDEETSSKEVPS